MSKSQEYLTEPLNQNMGFYFRPEDRLYHEKTPYQDLEIFSSTEFGNILRLDGVFQTSERDEFLYHEPLAHVPGVTIGGANRSLVIGGGDGGTAEELLKYNTAARAKSFFPQFQMVHFKTLNLIYDSKTASSM